VDVQTLVAWVVLVGAITGGLATALKLILQVATQVRLITESVERIQDSVALNTARIDTHIDRPR